MRPAFARRLLAALAACCLAASAVAQITVASTTSTEQSGLFGHLLPAFRAATGITVKVVAVGTGQAIDIARRGDADVLLVHDPAAEEKFVADGFAERRHAVMSNDFVLVGPASDPARAAGRDIAEALRRIAATGAPFLSRGDRSGTHAAELRYWALAQADRSRSALRECGCGMGPALNIAASTGAYVLADRGTWLAFRNRAGLSLLVQGDARLFNPYGVLAVSAQRHPHVQAAQARQFVDWLTSAAGQAAIASFRIEGQQVFFPEAAAGQRPSAGTRAATGVD